MNQGNQTVVLKVPYFPIFQSVLVFVGEVYMKIFKWFVLWNSLGLLP